MSILASIPTLNPYNFGSRQEDTYSKDGCSRVVVISRNRIGWPVQRLQ